VASAGQSEFRDLFPTLYARSYRVAYRLLGDRGSAEEVAQEAMTRTYEHWRRLDDRREGWVVTTTVNIVIDLHRRERRRQKLGETTMTAAATDTDDYAAQRLDLRRLLAALPRRQRQVAVLRYLEDRPEAEVAALLGCSVGSVKRHAARAAAALRQALALEAGGWAP
jgi:RNA polymerase sigma factor (sigma-70 family)